MNIDMQYRILLAEDDPNLGMVLKDSLELHGHTVELFENGEKAWKSFSKDDFDICILDVMMPLKDGFTLAKQIREVDYRIPIIFLTAKSLKEDKIAGFELGADDYITKPFDRDELRLRVDAVMRRIFLEKNPQDETLHFEIGDYTYAHDTRILSINNDERKLTTKEGDLLRLLAQNKNKTLNRDVALKHIWGNDSYFTGRSMDVYVTKLRKYLKKDERIEIINVHGKGFRLIESM
ncbi:MAG: response regulator transcription factor [Chitinophagales bacterium]